MFTVVLRYLSDLQEFCKLRKPLAPIVLPLHGRGRWFDPSIAHSSNPPFCRQNVEHTESSRLLSKPCATLLSACSGPQEETQLA